MSSPLPPPVEPSTPQTATLPVAVSRWERLHAYRLLWWLGLAVFVADQLTKIWIAATLPFPTYEPPGAITVIDGFFYITHVGNTGAAWSLFAGQTTMLALLAVITLGGIYFWRSALELRKRPVQLAFGLLCGGIIGNLVDRVLHGHVIDFLDFHFGSYVYPTFNIADAGICIGVVIYLIHSLRQPAAAAESSE
jgi:signal peptidase II